MIKTYSELKSFNSFEDRFNYLKLNGLVGEETYGANRYINQQFYLSREWKRVRDLVIIRDNGCDLGLPDFQLYSNIFVHHMNPITEKDIEDSSDFLLNPEYLICVSYDTHNALHYGNINYIKGKTLIERTQYDTCPWR